MPYSLALALAAFAAALLLTPSAMAVARRAGAVDHPGPRRIHRVPVPTMGGLALVAAVLGVAWLARALPGPARQLDPRPLVGLTLAAIPMLFLGVVDDLRGAGPWSKLGVQACAAIVLVHFGYAVPVLSNPFGGQIAAGAWSGPLVVLWVLVVVNAINLIDGLDGLAAGVVLIASATLWWVGHGHGDTYVMFFAAILIGASLGFLRWNFPPARVFMGDTGSHFLGLVMAAVSLLENRKGTAALTLLLPLVALGVPIVDGILAFARRLLSGRHVFHPDTGHVHHRLLRLGLPPRAALFALWGLCVALAVVAVILAGQSPRIAGPAVLLLAVALVVVFQVLEAVGRRRTKGLTEAEDEPETRDTSG